jgi:hypothetical protein
MKEIPFETRFNTKCTEQNSYLGKRRVATETTIIIARKRKIDTRMHVTEYASSSFLDISRERSNK